VKEHFRSNPGALFILAFQVLLVSATVFLVHGDSSFADQIAIYAFYALVIGIAVQIGVAIREERKRTRTRGTNDAPEVPSS